MYLYYITEIQAIIVCSIYFNKKTEENMKFMSFYNLIYIIDI